MTPVIAIVGESQSGKTSLIEKLLVQLGERGYRVATIKHTMQPAQIDKAGKDSWRHIQAGSRATALVTPDKMAIIRPTTEIVPVEEVLRILGEEYDLVIAEGFKETNLPKIEVLRAGAEPHLEAIGHVVALVTEEPIETKVRRFSPDEIVPLTNFIEQGFIKPQQGAKFSLYVNGQAIMVNSYIRELISTTIMAMVSTLKGVTEIEDLELRVRKLGR